MPVCCHLMVITSLLWLLLGVNAPCPHSCRNEDGFSHAALNAEDDSKEGPYYHDARGPDATAGQPLLRASPALLCAMSEPAAVSRLGKLPIKSYTEYIKIFH